MDFEVVFSLKPKLRNPVLVEGLPGIGNVGKIAVGHLIRELRAKKFARLYYSDFPPQVIVRKSGYIEEMKNEFYYFSGERDIVFITGNTQALSPPGQYSLAWKIMEIAEELGVVEVYTLGGLGVGRNVEKPRVFAATTSRRFKELLKEKEVVLERDGEGQIIGISGLLMALAKMKGLPGLCLMGETSGFYPDYRAAGMVLELLAELLNISVNVQKLLEKGRENEKKREKTANVEQKIMESLGLLRKDDEELGYIG